MSSDYYGPADLGPSPFDEFLARIYGGSGPGRPVQRVDITRLMSGPARELLGTAAAQVAEHGGTDLDTEHLLWAAARLEPTRELLARAGADPDALAAESEQQMTGHERRGEPPQLTPGAKRALLDAHQISRAVGSTYIGPEHILFALAVNPESGAGRMLAAAHVTPDALQRVLAGQAAPGQGGRSATPTLDDFGRDLTDLATEGKIDPVIGRDDEIDQTVEVLSRRVKNNPVLIGEAGVGKTAIVEGIAQRIADDEVPQTLAGKRVMQLDLSGVVAGTRYRGDFEERMKRIIEEIRGHGEDLIVFIDELHTLVGAGSGSEGGMDAGNMLKPPWPAASCTSSARPRSTSTARTSRRTRRWPGGSSPSWSPSRRLMTRSRSCAGCATGTRRTIRFATPTRRCWPRSSCPTVTSATVSCPTRPSTSSTRPARGSGSGPRHPAMTCANCSAEPTICIGTRIRRSPASATSEPPSCATRSARSGAGSTSSATSRPRSLR